MIFILGGGVLHHLDCQSMTINDILYDSDKFILMQQDPSNLDTSDQYKKMLGKYISSIYDYKINCAFSIVGIYV